LERPRIHLKTTITSRTSLTQSVAINENAWSIAGNFPGARKLTLALRERIQAIAILLLCRCSPSATFSVRWRAAETRVMRRENALYGRELGRRFHLEAAPTFVTQTLKSSEIAVTSMRLTRRNSEITEPLPVEDAHIVALPYEACDDHEIWLEGKCIDSEPFRAGVTTFYDLRRAPRAFLSVTRLARKCGLSVTHFSRAFRRSVGMPPHQWLLHRRVDKARSLLECSKQELSEIALACGFADQSHFTRVFSRLVGTSPRAWRLGR